MKRLLVATGTAAAVALSAAAALAGGTHHVTLRIKGTQTAATAPVTSGSAVLTYAVTVSGSDGAGRGTFVTSEKSLLSGTTRGTVTLAHGSITSVGTYSVATFTTTGAAKLTTTGHFTHGTGSYAGISGHYSGTGTLDLSTNVLKLHLHGSSTY